MNSDEGKEKGKLRKWSERETIKGDKSMIIALDMRYLRRGVGKHEDIVLKI